MTTVPSQAHQIAYADSAYQAGAQADTAMRALIASTWQVMEQVRVCFVPHIAFFLSEAHPWPLSVAETAPYDE